MTSNFIIWGVGQDRLNAVGTTASKGFLDSKFVGYLCMGNHACRKYRYHLISKWDLCMRLATQISSALTDMEKKYESLATVLSEATVAPDQITQSQAESFLWIQNATHFMGICLPSSLS